MFYRTIVTDSKEPSAMKTAVRLRPWLLGLLVLLLGVLALLFILRPKSDPHAGQVYLYDGFDWIWYTPLEGVEVNPWTEESFDTSGAAPVYRGTDYATRRGIDVSEHQHEIDWRQVAASGVDYAYIRLGRRGYTEGGLFEDPFFTRNFQGASDAGLDVGVYFFSQAVSVQEAIEEADFVLARLRGHTVHLPVVYDWEKITEPDARTLDVTAEVRTQCAIAFCETVKNAGYTPCVYFNRNLGYYGYDLSRLTDYEFWFALPEASYPSFYYAVDSWQYSFTETVPGIDYATDMSLRFEALPAGAGNNEE